MTRGNMYNQLDELGSYLTRQTGVTVIGPDDPITVRLNDRKDGEGNPEDVSYESINSDYSEFEGNVVAKVVEGDIDQWESILEPDTSTQLEDSRNYSLTEKDDEMYIETAEN